MTTKDYKLIARVIHKEISDRGYVMDNLIDDFCKELIIDNPFFNEVMFKNVCKYGEEVWKR